MDTTSLQHANRRVYIIDDLLGAILLIAAAALVVLLDLTRRQICAVYQLAFALCAASVFFIVGGLIDHHLSNDQLNMALYGSYLSSSLTTSYIYLPTLASVGVSIAVLFSLSTCSCDCCCLVGASASTHQRCFSSRIRANGSLYGTCFLWLYVAIGTRLNVRLRESAINPVGGTVHWMLLRSPFYLAMAHIGSLLLVGLKIFLQHADNAPNPHARMDFNVNQLEAAKAPANVAVSTGLQSSNTSMVDELMRPPPAKTFALAPRRVSDVGKQSLPRSPQAVTLATKSELKASPRATSMATTKGSRRPSANNNNREPQNDGDVSSLISSDSDSDDSVLRPSFRPSSSSEASAASARSAKTLPPRHSTAISAVVRKRPSGGSSSMASGYSSSPPPSPTHSTASSGSFSTSRARANTTSSRPSSSSSSLTRPRLTSSGSSASTTFLSDNDDHLLSNLEAYGSSGNEASYASDYRPAAGIRRRAPSLGATARRVPTTASPAPAVATSEWIECLDETTGSAYYYNTLTSESRWKEQ